MFTLSSKHIYRLSMQIQFHVKAHFEDLMENVCFFCYVGLVQYQHQYFHDLKLLNMLKLNLSMYTTTKTCFC